MRKFYLGCIVSLIMLCALYACGQTKKTTGKNTGSKYLQVLSGSVQRSFLGVRAAEPVIEYRLLVIWKQEIAPESFFWRSESCWMNCLVYRPHRKKPGDLALEEIRKGDTLELIPTRKGKFSTPAGIPNVKNAIFFKTSKTDWLYSAVKNLTKKPDIVMP